MGLSLQTSVESPTVTSEQLWVDKYGAMSRPTVRCTWPLDASWYTAHISGYNSEIKQHRVKYEDGDEEKSVLSNERIKFHVSSVEKQNLELECCEKRTEAAGIDVEEMMVLAASLDDCQEIDPGDIIWAKLTGTLAASDSNVMDDDQIMLDPGSNLGIFIRRCLLAFNQMPFGVLIEAVRVSQQQEPVISCGQNAFSSLFFSHDESRGEGEEPQNLLPEEVDFMEFKDEAKFLKAHGTLPGTPAEIRKALGKWEYVRAHDGEEKSSSNLRSHNASTEKLKLEKQADESPIPIKLFEEWDTGSGFSEDTPSSYIFHLLFTSLKQLVIGTSSFIKLTLSVL